jgi:hypothetical protein
VREAQLMKDGRDATQAYRVRVGGTWYWVDPTVPRGAIEPGDTVVIYPADGAATFAVLRSTTGGETIAFSALEGDRFEMAARGIAALHLAAVDEEQSP